MQQAVAVHKDTLLPVKKPSYKSIPYKFAAKYNTASFKAGNFTPTDPENNEKQTIVKFFEGAKTNYASCFQATGNGAMKVEISVYWDGHAKRWGPVEECGTAGIFLEELTTPA